MDIKDDYDIKMIFEEIELKLIESMKRTLWYHKEDEKVKNFDWPQWQALKLNQIKQFRKNNKEIFGEYESKVNNYVSQQIKKQFREGASRTKKQAIELGKFKNSDNSLGGSFFGINDRKVNALIKTVKTDLSDVKHATLRMSDDVFRSTIFKAEMSVSMGASTVQQSIDMATKDFLARGYDCIMYKNGSKHNIADYCDMAIRTATKRANLMGEGEMRKELGNPFVYISKHGGACKKCTPWEGRVYIDDVWSGGTEQDGEYPLLSSAIEGGLFHPRCRHGSSTYYEEINDEPEEVASAKTNTDEQDKYTQYLQQRQKQFERLAAGSLYQPNILEYKNKVFDLQNQIESSKMELSDDEQYAINQYISTESYKLNEALRDGLELKEQQKVVIDNLDKALNKFSPYEGITARSLILDKEELKKFLQIHKVGNNITYRAYTSATVGNRYNELSNVELHIKSKNGRDIRRFNKEEQEIVFKRNTEFKIIQSEEVNKVYHIYMEEL